MHVSRCVCALQRREKRREVKEMPTQPQLLRLRFRNNGFPTPTASFLQLSLSLLFLLLLPAITAADDNEVDSGAADYFLSEERSNDYGGIEMAAVQRDGNSLIVFPLLITLFREC